MPWRTPPWRELTSAAIRFTSSGRGMSPFGQKKMNGKLIQVLPLDLRMPRAEAERLARAEIGATVNNILVTEENLEQRIGQYMHHGLCNAVGMGEKFILHDLNFSARDGTALLLA